MKLKENNRVRKDVHYETLVYKFLCKKCGKEFAAVVNRQQYAYKRGNDVFCSWGCLRAWDAKHTGKGKRRYEHSSAQV